MTTSWQKSSYCSEGASCIHISTGPPAVAVIRVTESGDPLQAVLTTAPTAFFALLSALKEEKSPRV